MDRYSKTLHIRKNNAVTNCWMYINKTDAGPNSLVIKDGGVPYYVTLGSPGDPYATPLRIRKNGTAYAALQGRTFGTDTQIGYSITEGSYVNTVYHWVWWSGGPTGYNGIEYSGNSRIILNTGGGRVGAINCILLAPTNSSNTLWTWENTGYSVYSYLNLTVYTSSDLNNWTPIKSFSSLPVNTSLSLRLDVPYLPQTYLAIYGNGNSEYWTGGGTPVPGICSVTLWGDI